MCVYVCVRVRVYVSECVCVYMCVCVCVHAVESIHVYYRMYKHLTSTYESGSMRLFLNGRTDTIRAASIESFAFCKAMSDPSASVSYIIL